MPLLALWQSSSEPFFTNTADGWMKIIAFFGITAASIIAAVWRIGNSGLRQELAGERKARMDALKAETDERARVIETERRERTAQLEEMRRERERIVREHSEKIIRSKAEVVDMINQLGQRVNGIATTNAETAALASSAQLEQVRITAKQTALEVSQRALEERMNAFISAQQKMAEDNARNISAIREAVVRIEATKDAEFQVMETIRDIVRQQHPQPGR